MATPPLAYRTTRVSISGTFAAGAEEWTTGFWHGYAGGDADLPTQQLADDIAAAWKAFVTALGSNMSGAWSSNEVKLSSLGTDGKASVEDTVYAQITPAAVGAGSLTFPPQISLAATMFGSKARGVGSKGRMYLPGIVAPVGGDGKISASAQTTITTAFKNFILAVNASTATDNIVVLASHGSLNKDGTSRLGGSGPVTYAVQGVRVGNVYDTQRRRRNSLTEQYVVSSLV